MGRRVGDHPNDITHLSIEVAARRSDFIVEFLLRREEFGPEPDVDEVYDHLIRLMQETLDALASERRLPLLG